jgi:TonB-linked SusC/RagA family outer membrane protein
MKKKHFWEFYIYFPCFPKKLFMVMKLSLILAFVFTFSLSASIYSQKTVLNVEIKDKSIREILKSIEQQSKFRFFFNDEYTDLNKTVSLYVKNKNIDETLAILFSDAQITYKVMDNNLVVITPTGLLTKKITGIVTDAGTGEPLVGVNVVIKGTTIGAITDVKGKFSVDVTEEGAVLTFSFVGYSTIEIPYTGQTNVEVKMSSEITTLEDIVVVGYGTQKKVNLTGAVDVVTSATLENRSTQNVGLMLQGASPNLNISLTTEGGKPGATTLWNIRGMGSINGNDYPLVLIDGVESQTDINNIDPESVESVSILKDASASAIYGSRAPFGVVLITTKHGKKNEPIRISYSDNLSFAYPIGVPRFVDSYTWATAYNEAAANSGLAPIYPDEQVQRIKGYMAGTYKTEYDPNNPPPSIWQGRWKGNANNDWPVLYWKRGAFSQKHNVNVEGGGDKTNYFISAGYFDQGGLNKWGNDGYKRYNVLANISSQATDWLRFDFSTKYTSTDQNQPLGIVAQTNTYIYRSFLSFAPMTPYYNIDGSVANPLVRALQSSGRAIDDNNDLGLTLGTEIEPVKGWKTNISFNYDNAGFTHTENPIPVPVELPTGGFGNIGYGQSGSIENLASSNYTLFNARTSYEKTMGSHYFKVLIGYEQELSNYRALNGSAMGLITPLLPSINTALGATTISDAISHWATQGVFGRLNYNFQEKYLLEFSARYNGSSRFAENSRFGFFPSVSAGYNIAKESFWQPLESFVNVLKIRASYGSLGNQNVANYSYLQTIPVSIQLPYIIAGERPIYAGVPNLLSSNLTWETVTTTDVGLDAAFMKSRLNLTFDWYNRITSNMIGPSESLPAVLGTYAPPSNNAKLGTKGWEISLGWNDRISSDLTYNIKFTIGDNTTTILKYKNDSKSIDNWNAGRKIGEIWGLTSDGLIQTAGEKMPDQSYYYPTWGPGDMKYKDLDGNDTINEGNRTLTHHGDLSVIANTSPHYMMGITAGLGWRGIDLSMFWQGVGKRDYLPGPDANIFYGIIGGGSPGSESSLFQNGPSLNYWRPANETNFLGPNTNAYFAKPYQDNQGLKNRQPQSRYVLSAAYMRLKNLQIGYTIPQKLTQKVSIYKARIYASGENLLTFTKLPKLMDPETTPASDPTYGGLQVAGGIYPIAKSLSFGINITF